MHLIIESSWESIILLTACKTYIWVGLIGVHVPSVDGDPCDLPLVGQQQLVHALHVLWWQHFILRSCSTSANLANSCNNSFHSRIAKKHIESRHFTCSGGNTSSCTHAASQPILHTDVTSHSRVKAFSNMLKAGILQAVAAASHPALMLCLSLWCFIFDAL